MALFNILIDVAAKTADFESGIKRVESQLESFGNTARKALEFAGVGLGIRELVDEFDNFVKHAEDLEHASQKIGIAVEDLSRLQFAAGQSGIATDQLTTGIERFARSAALAAAGTGQQAQAFEAMGISVTDAAGQLKPMNQLLLETADKFASYKDSTEKTALALMLFGRAGADMIPLLNKGAQGISELGARADDLGATLGDSTAKAAERFNSKLGELHAVAQGFWKLTAEQLLPVLTSVVDKLTGAGSAARKFDEEIEPLVTGLKLIVDAGYSVYRTFVDIGTALGAVVAIGVQAAQGHFKEAGDIWRRYTQDAKAAEQDANDFLARLWNEGIQNSTDWQDNLVASWNAVAEAAKKNAPVIDNSLEKMLAESEAFQLEWEKRGLSQVGADTDRIAKQGESSVKQMVDRIPAYGKTMWDQLDEISQRGAQSIQGAFANFLFDPASKGFSGLVIDFANALKRMVADAAAAQIFKALFGQDKEGNSGLGGKLGQFLGAFLGGHSAASTTDTGINFEADAALFGGGMADGGPLEQGKWYIAGERGPEPIWGGGSGAYAAGYGSQGSTVLAPVYNIDARGATTDLIARLPVILKQNNDALENQIVTRLRRNAYG